MSLAISWRSKDHAFHGGQRVLLFYWRTNCLAPLWKSMGLAMEDKGLTIFMEEKVFFSILMEVKGSCYSNGGQRVLIF